MPNLTSEYTNLKSKMVGKNEMKSPPPNRAPDAKEEPKIKDLKLMKEDNRGPRMNRDRDNANGPPKPGHEQMERGQEREFRGGRGGGRGGRGGRGGFQGGPRGDGGHQGGHQGGPRVGGGGNRDGRPEGRGGQYRDDQPQVSLEEALPPTDKKFTGRCRLFIGNMPADTTEDEFKEMFSEHGEFTEVFLNSSRGFGFIRMDFRKNAEAAKAALDGVVRKGRTLRVRFATHGAALKVKYLTEYVTNEVLAQAFSIFGELERAVVIVDDRGKPTGDGIVEFARKPGAQAALKRISEGVFMLGSSPRPVTVEPLEQKDEEDGYPEKFVQKSANLQREREQAPRFAPVGSFEFDFGNKWKELYQMHEEQQRNLKRQFEDAIAKIEIEQAGAMMEHQTNMLRQDLLRRQEELRRLEELHQMELQKRMERVNRSAFESGGNPFRRVDEDRRIPQEDDRRRQEVDMRRQQQEDRRQQELFAQQERAMREMRGERGGEHAGHGNAPPMQPPPAPPAGMGIERGQGGRQGAKGMGNHGGMGGSQGNIEGSNGNFGGEAQPLRQSRFDQPPGFSQGHGGMAEGNMGGGMGGNNHGGNLMGMGRGGSGGGSGSGGNMSQQERMMQERQMQERQQQQQGRRGQDSSMREQEYFEAKRPRRY